MDRWLEKDVTIRVLSLILALAMWFQVSAEQNPTVSRSFKNVTVKAQNLDQGLVLMDLAPKTVSATVQGQRRAVFALKEEEVIAYVDLKSIEAGKASVPVQIVVPRTVELLETLPGQVSITADTVTRKKVKVEVRSMGTPAEEYVALSGQTKTVDTTVEGPKSRVALVARAVADVDISGATADVSKTVTLRALDIDGKEVKDISLLPRTADVRIPMRKLPPAKTVQVKVEVQGPPKEGYKVTAAVAEPATCRVRGPADVLQRIESVSTRPVDVRGVASDFERQVDINLPAGISLVEPKAVLARVSIAEDRIEKTISKVPVEVKNLTASLKATLTPAEVSVNVEGPRQLIEKLTPKSIQVYIDALGLAEGQHGASIQVDVPQNVSLLGTSQDIVTVILKKK